MPIINNLSGNEIEILKLADFLTGVEHDITDVYFGELQVFTVWAETEGTLPLTINANGEPLINYKIYGNTAQAGTPTPDNPVDVVGCGVRTENLFDGELLAGAWASEAMNYRQVQGDVYRSMKLTLSPGIYTLVFSENVYLVRKIVNNVYSEPNTNISDMTFTVETLSDVGFSFRMVKSKETPWDSTVSISVNTGSTALPYEPYGYKLPVTTANGADTVTTPVYTGVEPLHRISEYADYVDYASGKIWRKIKKLVLTGEEDWRTLSIPPYTYATSIIPYLVNTTAISSHFRLRRTLETLINGTFMLNNGNEIYMKYNNKTSVDAFRQFLAQQYAAGTPVTIWYVLATPVEEDPPVALPALPTLDGTTVYDADLVTKPSKMYVKYRKHGT